MSHPEDILGHPLQLGVLGDRQYKTQQIYDYNDNCSGLKCILYIPNLEIYKKILLTIFWSIQWLTAIILGLDVMVHFSIVQ